MAHPANMTVVRLNKSKPKNNFLCIGFPFDSRFMNVYLVFELLALIARGRDDGSDSDAI